MKQAIVLPAIALLAACAAIPAAPVREGPVALGQTAYVDGPRVTPLELVEDSRCPADVQCVQAGRVVVRTKIHLGGSDLKRDLTLGEPVGIADGALELVSVEPDPPSAGSQPEPGEYRFTFRFNGGL